MIFFPALLRSLEVEKFLNFQSQEDEEIFAHGDDKWQYIRNMQIDQTTETHHDTRFESITVDIPSESK